MSEYNSLELRNAISTPSSITDNNINNIDINKIKEDLRLFIFSKDKSLLAAYDLAAMTRVSTNSSNETLKCVLTIIRNFYENKNRNDDIKLLTIKKTFDIINLCLDGLFINNIDISSSEANVLLLSYLNKNFL